jgi:glycolate oxidase FAD binding subunit
LAQVLPGLARTLGDAPFIADIANGQLYLCATQAVQAIQQAVRGAGGYTVVLSAPAHRRGEFDIWGYAPETIDLMRKLKARWDPHGLLNPGAFLV